MYVLPTLPYDYDALEPHIDAQTMHLHHKKHHQAYVDKLNAALGSHTELSNLDIYELMARLDQVPQAIRRTVQNNGGGHANHSFFWQVMSPEPSQPEDRLLQAIKSSFSGLDEFKQGFIDAAVGQFGSGWAWLVVKDAKLTIMTTPNQDNPWMQALVPILGVDVWEHAYYLKYQNRRPEYLESWWHLVNWPEVLHRFEAAA